MTIPFEHLDDPFEHLDEIYFRAASLEGDEQREYLEVACAGDSALRREVEKLLWVGPQAERFFENGPAPLAPIGIAESVGTVLGPYKLREQIGEGGFGVVYVAEQTEPVQRKVALKIIKPGMETRDVIARFEAERQALAMMDHPNVAKVFDAGTTGSGRPYFVMELIHGIPITEFCDQRKLSVQRRLELFVDVCRAVQHAHQKGIIHRDLKPSNVMITLHDDKPVVKVIDFGVSKALSQQLTEKSLYTAYGQVIGSPLYMSPEQAQLSGLDVDTRSDVYSLGVLLYELLSGSTPFDKETLRKSGFDEMRWMIRKVDPPRPSTRISTLRAQALTTVSDCRRIDPKKFSQYLRRELDWIVMMALEKDRTRRYESANAFADDIVRYLHDEPIVACPPSAAYRLRKSTQRYKGAFFAAVSVLLALLVGTGVAAWQAVRATNAEQKAKERLAAAEHHRRRAEQAVVREREETQTAMQLLYATNMLGAAEAWRDGDPRRSLRLLQQHTPVPGQFDARGFEWHLLRRQLRVKQRGNRSLGEPVYFVQYGPDRQSLAAVGKNARVVLLDAETLRERASFATGQSEVNSVAFSPDSARLATAGDDGTIRLWDPETHEELHRIDAHRAMAFGVVFALGGKLLVSCGDGDALIRLWDARSGEPKGTLKGHRATRGEMVKRPNSIEAISLASNGWLLGSVGEDATARLWDLRTEEPLHVLEGHDDEISGLDFSPDGHYLATGSRDQTVRIWDTRTGERTFTASGPYQFHSVAFVRCEDENADRSDRYLAAGDRGGSVHLWRVAPQSSRFVGDGTSWAAHEGRIYSLQFSPDRQRIITAGSDGQVRAWGRPDARLGRTLHGHREYRNYDLAFTRNPCRLVTAHDRAIELWDPETGQRTGALVEDNREWQSVAVVPDSSFLVAGDMEGNLHFWDIRQRRELHDRMIPARAGGHRLAVSADGRFLAVASIDREWTRLYRLPEGELMDEFPGRNAGVAAFSPKTPLLCRAGDRYELQLWDCVAKRPRFTCQGHVAPPHAVAFSPDGSLLVTGDDEGHIKLWNTANGRELGALPGQGSEVKSLGFSTDGSSLVSSTEHGRSTIWHVPTRQKLFEFGRFPQPVDRVGFSPDGRWLVCCEANKRLTLFDLAPADPG